MLLGRGKRRVVFISFILACTFLLAFYLSFNKSSENEPPPIVSSSSTSEKPKVFVIGLSKTGTTSVGDALSLLSFSRLGWEDLRSRFLFRSYLRLDPSPTISLTQHYDAFEDLPWALVYQDMARLYPDAKFILMLRENEVDWLKSIKAHTARRKWIGYDLIHGGMRAEGNEQAYLDVYRRHTSSVREFFEAEGNGTRLLEFVIDGREREGEDEGETWGVLLKFLEMEESDEVLEELGDFPWSNRTADFMGQEIMKNLAWFWDRFMFYVEEALLGMFRWLGWVTAWLT